MSDIVQKNFNAFLHTELNDQQRAAVEQPSGALLVIAGAGSGKTRVITSRIANLVINHHVDARSIVALTFTNKAAGEMRERLVTTFRSQYETPFIGTFHSYCLLLLRNNPDILSFPRFSILDADDQIDLIKKICKNYAVGKQYTPTNLCHLISLYKNGLAQQNISGPTWPSPLVRDIYIAYEAEKASAHCLDFDDLIVTVVQALQTKQHFREQLQKNVRHLLIDEYQDTSHVQHNLLLHIARNNDNNFALDSLCAVGDEDQSIYSWRGATVTNMLKFTHDYAPVTTVRIEQNYRSVQPILQAANAVISNNKLRNPKELWSSRAACNRILHLACQTGDQEARTVAALAKNRRDHKSTSSLAILYRTHFQSRTLEEALIHHAIPYRIVGGIRFYERKEVKDLLAYLRLIANPYDKISLMRILNTPARGLGQKTEEQILHAWTTNTLFDFKQLFNLLLTEESVDFSASKQEALRDFLKIFDGLDATQTPSNLLDLILERTNYISYLSQAYDPQEAQSKIDNVHEFVQAVFVFEQKHEQAHHNDDSYKNSPLEAFLHEVSLLQEKIDADTTTDFVPLMTLHAAKGLEFDTVIITGLEEGLLPNTRSLNTNEALEEERRLMYVGMTRAKERLIITSAQSRFTFGQVMDQATSRFLDEIPSSLMQTIAIDTYSIHQAPSFFDQWFGKGIITHSRQAPSAETRSSLQTRPTPSSRTSWTKNQTVFHQKFGVGIITDVEKAPEESWYITALFKSGKKKILSDFLQKK